MANAVWLYFTFITYISQTTLVPGFAAHSKLSDQLKEVVSVLPQVWEEDLVIDIDFVTDATSGIPAENSTPSWKQSCHWD